jgi:hypothetical protein
MVYVILGRTGAVPAFLEQASARQCLKFEVNESELKLT